MLTGDSGAAARCIAEQAGVEDFRASLLPEGKLRCMQELVEAQGESRGRGFVGMAGDGINDAPALARADIGFAMAGGTDAAMETADATLMDADLRKIPRFIRLSRRVHAILMQNIALALGMKALFLALTLAGHTHGGQICLPGRIPFVPHASRIGDQYAHGMFEEGGKDLFVTRGVGESRLRMRLFCPPEIVIIDLVPTEALPESQWRNRAGNPRKIQLPQ